MSDNEYGPDICEVIQILGSKWVVLVLGALFSGPQRFKQLQRKVSIVRTQSLTTTLRHMEQNGLVHREVFPKVPITVEYSLTAKGSEFYEALRGLENWVEKWRQQE